MKVYKILAAGLLFASLCSLNVAIAQVKIPVLRTNTKDLNVRDGHNFYKGYWTVSPDVKKDIYYAHRFKTKTTITFYSDIDSISFTVTPRQTYDFMVLLNQKDTCYTQISTIRSNYYKDCRSCIISADTIPFILGNDNRVYITGKVNGSATLKFFFDDGADNTILFPSAFKKGAKLKFDGEVVNRATGGVETRRTSDFNDLEVAKLKWNNEQVMFINKQIGEGDGTIGYNVFEDKVIELDYEKKLMIIHDTSFVPGKGYAKFEMQLNGGEVPSVPGTLIIYGKKYTADFLFDMGATGCLFFNQGFLSQNNLYGTMTIIGESKSTGAGNGAIKTETALLPAFIFGNYKLKQVPVNLENPAEHDPGTGVLGMDILKRFNTIIDYQNNVIYVKANRLITTPFKSVTTNATRK
ncbi:pepsin/retropepsin-like aspartic protease family protein [Mucilaginibacter sp. UR6-11]|uniref:pepsin/retropepsin-like aspartic protease family protein n=1 Tax=Mucilaginibacter sp. UR6-11 TaxID=1435644 RepID=UPI001E55A417|nr:pepsin/retropepsin-like aspartic protease family protein [Mucilaginibacter sp. UR6-11]MCC8426443.1 aspartyl protease family protein [Mucilaginibacter sp. UR6-11]